MKNFNIGIDPKAISDTGFVAMTGLALYLAHGRRKFKKRFEKGEVEAEQLRHEVKHDDLTGLLNKKTFLERANQQLAEAKPGQMYAMLFIDLDNFKAVNEKLPGQHAEGDAVLKSVASILSKDTRQKDHDNGRDLLVRGSSKDPEAGRLGGDEFAIFVELTSRNEIGEAMSNEERLEALQSRLYSDFSGFMHHRPDLEAIGFGMSIGATLLQEDDTAETMLARGDAAILAVKDEHHLVQGQYRPS